MPVYKYIATDSKGRNITGSQEASSQEDVAANLHDQGLVVISVDETLGLSWEMISNLQIGGVPLKDRVIFVKQLSVMLSAGLPLIQALDILVQQSENPSLKGKLEKVYKDVASGINLSEAFKKEETMFSPVQINLLVAGEKSGNLNEMMQKIAVDLEKSRQLRAKILGAMIYPAILIIVLIGVIVAMMVFMVPAVKDLYSQFGSDADLPFVTQLLINISGFVASPLGAAIIIGSVVFVVGGVQYYRSTYKGRRNFDRFMLKVPIFGNLQRKVQLAEFNRLISMLLKSGVPIVDTLRIVANALSNTAFSDLVKESAIEVSKGNSLSIPLAKGDVFPLMMLKMLATGEETGKVDQVTEDMGKFYEQEVDEITANLAKLMEPMIMVMVGGVVAFLAIAIYLPIYQLGQITQ